jgi:hypothetical protein
MHSSFDWERGRSLSGCPRTEGHTKRGESHVHNEPAHDHRLLRDGKQRRTTPPTARSLRRCRLPPKNRGKTLPVSGRAALNGIASSCFRGCRIRADAGQGLTRRLPACSERDHLSARYARSVTANVDPLSVSGANVPGFPVGEDLSTDSGPRG